mmetsp:Transcript_24496/g.53278  ORF Transcript_24496/g.53278 Transcript_24496/m.53278 type:complete len:561 (-) Transcript_24496:182-1864(-)
MEHSLFGGSVEYAALPDDAATSATATSASSDPATARRRSIATPILKRLGVTGSVLLACGGFGVYCTPRQTTVISTEQFADEFLAATPKSLQEDFPACPNASRAHGPFGLPQVYLLGGPDPLPRPKSWTARICTPLYEGPDCSNATTWEGVVTLCIDGVSIPGVKVKTRGHVSTMFPKHQFAMKLPKAVGLLGMKPSRSWTLAMSFADTSYQRNALAFDFYRRLGGWAAHTVFVTVNWKGIDYGLYYIGEKIERSPNRLNMAPVVPNHPEESGYLISSDWPKPGKACLQSANTSTDIIVMDPEEVTPKELVYLQNLIDKIDSIVVGPSREKLKDYVDFTSFARFFVVEELAEDVDGYAFSVFMTVERGRLIHAAPWDFDLAFGFICDDLWFTNAYTGKAPRADGSTSWNVENLRDSTTWIGKSGFPNEAFIYFGKNRRAFFMHLWQHPGFRRRFFEVWEEARSGPLADEALEELVYLRTAKIAAAAEHDMTLWAGDHCAFFACCSEKVAADFHLASRHLISHLLERAAWIDKHVRDPPRPAWQQPLTVPPASGPITALVQR